MSMRQPVGRRQQAVSSKKPQARRMKAEARRASVARDCLLPTALRLLLLVFHIVHLARAEAAQELGGLVAVELRVGALDEQEEAVARGEREVRRVEDRMIRLGQAVQREHAEDR